MTQALQDFFQRVSVDATLQAACSEAVAHGDLDTIVRLGADAGFTFTVEDLKQAWASQSSELSEEDLAKAAGGLASFHKIWAETFSRNIGMRAGAWGTIPEGQCVSGAGSGTGKP
jgi:predicted ribosomally synthesized peptide with nif11-like leader